MKKTKAAKAESAKERDTMRPEYDFSGAVRGATATRYAEGTNVVVIEPEVLDVFPDSKSVNEALRALASVIRSRARRGEDSDTTSGVASGKHSG